MPWESLRRSLQRGSLAGRDAAPLPAGLVPAARTPGHDPVHELLGEALREEVQRLFRGSLKLRHLDAGSCNGCEAELAALLNPFYDIQRFGIDLVASPRHADGLLLTGPVTRHLEEAARLTIEATPRPRLLIAVGDCACDGGFCADSFAVLRGADALGPVDVRIPGCPPRPADIVRALLAALGRERVRTMVATAPEQ
jgi:Ni,Fe-hydrogenase III small subunit